MIVIVDGPEKAGKSTIIRSLTRLYEKVDLPCRVRHWGPTEPDDRVYTPYLQEDVHFNGIVVWDRSWASEHVYAKLLGRTRRLAEHPWLGEWYHGRAVQPIGTRIMLLGPSVKWLEDHRDETDLPVDPAVEREAFREYGKRFGWTVIENMPEMSGRVLLTIAMELTFTHRTAGQPQPPEYCGPVDAPVIFVGEERAEKFPPGGWLPFSTSNTTTLGYQLGDLALDCGWTNAHDCPPQFLRRRELIVACGKRAASWVHHYVGSSSKVLEIAHPSWMYRFNNEASKRAVEHSKVVLDQVRLVLKGDVK